MSYNANFIVKGDKTGLPVIENVNVDLVTIQDFVAEGLIDIELWDGTYVTNGFLGGCTWYTNTSTLLRTTNRIPIIGGVYYVFSGGDRCRLRWTDDVETCVGSYSGPDTGEPQTVQAPVTATFVEYYYSASGHTNASVKEIEEYDFPQPVLLEAGTYLIECWGAQGNYNRTAVLGGLGGYAKGIITITEPTQCYVTVGRGNKLTNVATFNGGGAGGASAGSGGAAADFRALGDTLNDRIIVAGAGGGASYSGSVGGDGGGLEAASTNGATGGTQTEGGSLGGSFGQGGSSGSIYRGGGGGGWFGGGAASPSNTGGAGGSSYIGDALTIELENFPKIPIIDGYTEAGVNSGNAKVKISAFLQNDTSDINGEVDFINLDPGEYFLLISHAGYSDYLNSFQIVDSVYTSDILLIPIRLFLTGLYLQVEIQEIAGSLVPLAQSEIKGLDIGYRVRGPQNVSIDLNKEIFEDDMESGKIENLTFVENELKLKEK